ncbi:MAG: ABC transporter permease [Clostridia bacterium]|nr:ABC transporter permease [Clostridia bacterium]
MKSIFTVIKKDIKRYFTDRRILVSLFLPGIIIFVMYSFMGRIISDTFTPQTDNYVIYAVNMPEEVSALLYANGVKTTVTDAADMNADDIKNDIREEKTDIYVVFEDDFMNKIHAYDALSSTEAAPQVKIYFNSTNTASQSAYSMLTGTLEALEQSISNRFDVNNPASGETYDCATPEDVSTTFITMIMPMLLMIFLWSGCMMIASESIAGEKERGTIATLLVTPVKRSHFALGKIIGLSMPALASAVCSFLGIMLSLPRMFVGLDVSTAVYGAGTYLAIFALTVITVLLFNIILVIISTFSKSVKEAAGYASVAMVPIMLIGVLSIMGKSATNPLLFLIPGFNSSQCFAAVLSLSFNPVNFMITVVSNAVYIGLGIWLLTRMFGNEKIMFGR